MAIPPIKLTPTHTVTPVSAGNEKPSFVKIVANVGLTIIAFFGATIASFKATERTIGTTDKWKVILGATVASFCAFLALGLMSFATAQAYFAAKGNKKSKPHPKVENKSEVQLKTPEVKPVNKPIPKENLNPAPSITPKTQVPKGKTPIKEEQPIDNSIAPIFMSKLQPSIIMATTKKPPIPKDIVCEFSQGNVTDIRNVLENKNKIKNLKEEDLEQLTAIDNSGSLACAAICMKAVSSYFEKGLPKTDKEIYSLIDQGVRFYTLNGFTGTVLFADVLTKLPAPDRQKITIVKPEEKDISASSLSESSFVPLAYTEEHELTADLNIYLDQTLNYLSKKAIERETRTCAILTISPANNATNATVVIMFDENKKPVLFNSHGQTYNGEFKGASLLRFEDMSQLGKYIKETLCYGVGGNFQFQALGEA